MNFVVQVEATINVALPYIAERISSAGDIGFQSSARCRFDLIATYMGVVCDHSMDTSVGRPRRSPNLCSIFATCPAHCHSARQ